MTDGERTAEQQARERLAELLRCPSCTGSGRGYSIGGCWPLSACTCKERCELADCALCDGTGLPSPDVEMAAEARRLAESLTTHDEQDVVNVFARSIAAGLVPATQCRGVMAAAGRGVVMDIWDQKLKHWGAVETVRIYGESVALMLPLVAICGGVVLDVALGNLCKLIDAVNAAYAMGYEDEGRPQWEISQ